MQLQQYAINKDNFEQCIKCTICTVYCPVAAVNPDYPGPKQAGPDGERLRLKKANFYDEALKYCINCKRCEVACPSNVRIGDIIQTARIKYSKKKPALRDFILSHTDLVGTLATPFAPLVNTFLDIKPVKKALDRTLKIDHRRSFPSYSSQTFESWYKKQAAEQLQYKTQVSYFHGCYANYNYPQLGKDLVKVMNACGVGVQLLAKKKCCGVALISNGFMKQAKKQAEVNMHAIRKSVLEHNRPVIATSSSCIFTIRDEYPHLLDIKNSDVRDQVELATRYLYRLFREKGNNLQYNDKKLKVAYHTPCHMEKLGWSYYSMELLRMIPGIELKILPSQCCGIAGTYGFKKENYTTSQEIGSSLFETIEKDDFDYVVTDCETCKWQIEMSTSRKCEHPVSILAKVLK
ncbi:MAG: anaerobic glycerol-3-phosphate dehydrogenase subunit C [Tannerellaceae bacterium]|nr:anaerobic glycerol-3-phosphate dehydrogenase subunit C [Tannerellaceae bacterium]